MASAHLGWWDQLALTKSNRIPLQPPHQEALLLDETAVDAQVLSWDDQAFITYRLDTNRSGSKAHSKIPNRTDA